jgi:hypothetical protein
MARDIDVQDLPPVMADDEEAVEKAKGDRWHSEEIHRRDSLPVIPQECEPAFCWLRISRCSPHPARDGSLRHIESEHQELSMDARRAPGWILRNHPKYQVSNLLRNALSSDHSARSGDRPPVQREPSPVPSHDGFRTHYDQGLLPAGPEPLGNNPEELIDHNHSCSTIVLRKKPVNAIELGRFHGLPSKWESGCHRISIERQPLIRQDPGVKLPPHQSSPLPYNSCRDGRGPCAPVRIGRRDKNEGRSRMSRFGTGACSDSTGQ